MGNEVIQQIILRREDEGAASAPETVLRVGAAGAVVIDERDSSLLIEGAPETLESATRAATGWRAFPLKRYSVPDARVRVKR